MSTLYNHLGAFSQTNIYSQLNGTQVTSGFLIYDNTFPAKWITDLSTTDKYVIPCSNIKPKTQAFEVGVHGYD